eukprot:CAMPEP_0177618550 /NCGR_PEP_ID=MMETSP0419_2-20121207/25648_1 /TAXON_ID=582737 /ORGANISM="Tetraselmis sp., Strain GSL018" /LENGTH=223 /DNA_ID=CAMNT_0019117481 /DNA_START=148 /DNA_END=815 /DNA_ORIENTATION=-
MYSSSYLSRRYGKVKAALALLADYCSFNYVVGTLGIGTVAAFLAFGATRKPFGGGASTCSSRGSRTEVYVAGLSNSGNLCFLNSILQAMSSCQALVSFLGEAVDRVGCVAGALSEVLAHLQPSPSASAAEHNLADGPRKAVLRWLSAPQLKTGGQQDAAEALELILSSVAEERVGSIAMQLEPLTRMGAVALEIGAGNASGESAAADEHSGSRSAVCVGLGDG